MCPATPRATPTTTAAGAPWRGRARGGYWEEEGDPDGWGLHPMSSPLARWRLEEAELLWASHSSQMAMGLGKHLRRSSAGGARSTALTSSATRVAWWVASTSPSWWKRTGLTSQVYRQLPKAARLFVDCGGNGDAACVAESSREVRRDWDPGVNVNVVCQDSIYSHLSFDPNKARGPGARLRRGPSKR